MKSFVSWLILAAGTALVVPAVQASTPSSQPKPITRQEAVKLPAPSKVVGFTQLPRRFENAVVHVVLTVDEKGTPRDVAGWPRMPADLAERILPAVSQWTFTPALDQDGNPRPMRVVLPLQLVAID